MMRNQRDTVPGMKRQRTVVGTRTQFIFASVPRVGAQGEHVGSITWWRGPKLEMLFED